MLSCINDRMTGARPKTTRPGIRNELAPGPSNNNCGDGSQRHSKLLETGQAKANDVIAKSTKVPHSPDVPKLDLVNYSRTLQQTSNVKSNLQLQTRLKQISDEGDFSRSTFSDTLSEREIVRKGSDPQSSCSTMEMSKDSLESTGELIFCSQIFFFSFKN